MTAPVTAVEIVEVAPRDGLQNDPADLTAEAKADMVAALLAAGIRRVEAASFVSPKAVPKMADGERVVELVRRSGAAAGATIIGLVVNERGVARAAAAGVDEINAVVATTDSFSRANQSMTVDESLDRLVDLVGAGRQAGLGVGVTISTSFGCPFDGEVPVGRVAEVAARVASIGVDEIAVADTIGCAVPTDVTARVAAVQEAIGAAATLRAHFHNTRNTGLANAAAAVAAGVSVLDASAGGIGGCPFAPRATGNIPTEDLVYMLERMGVVTGVDLDALCRVASGLPDVLGHDVPGQVGKAGIFPAVALGRRS
jgi:hydroxymethylglutaryl-CoA lyase